MKKLFVLFSVLAFFSLILIGCQKSEDINGPGELNKPPVSEPLDWVDPLSMDDLDNDPVIVDLIAGQFYNVGSVTVAKFDGGIKVTFNVSAPAGVINEVHVDLASTLDVYNDPENLTGFHTTKDGNPQFGQFDHKQLGNVSDFNTNVVEVIFTPENLMEALGVESLDEGIEFFIAAHAVVCWAGGDQVDICTNLYLANGAKLKQGITLLGRDDTPEEPLSHYFVLTFDKFIVDELDSFNGWCLDPKRGFPDSEPANEILGYYERPLNFVCSITDECIVTFPENLKKVNWIINNRDGYDAYAVQAAIWMLLSDETDWQETGNNFYDANWQGLFDDLAEVNIDLWEPGCGDKILIIGYEPSTEQCDLGLVQTFGLEVEIECEERCETAMGFDAVEDGDKWIAIPGNSSLFPKHQWFRYFSFTW